MEWSKIPTELLIQRIPDNEYIAVVKYQSLWSLLERQPDDREALRYMTNKQLTMAKQWLDSIEVSVMSDINSVNNKRGRNKKYYNKKQSVSENSDGLTDGLTDGMSDGLTASTDKIREDKIIGEKKRVEKKSASRTPVKLRFEDVEDWESLFEYWEQNKKGGRYANAESRNRMLAKLRQLTADDFDYAKQAIIYAVDSKYQGFSDGSKLYFKGPPPTFQSQKPNSGAAQNLAELYAAYDRLGISYTKPEGVK